MKKLTTTLLVTLAVGLMGCAEKKSKPGASADPVPETPAGVSTIDPGAGPWTPTGSGPCTGPGSGWTQGGTATLDIVSVNRLEEYAAEPRNNPQNIRLNLNLSKKGTNTYGGSATIAYTDYGNYDFEGNFTSGSADADNQYNVWLEVGGKRGFHAFFEDGLGAIIVVIDDFEIIDGDGKIGDTVGGKVYFKNFDPNTAPPGAWYYPGYYVERVHCWFISLGPNDCRAWKSGSGVNTYAAIYPDSGYQLLGTFSGMSIEEAFNGDVELNQ